jgi:succinate-semialdehyde dehydrogenase/glutarate-semialdehyde dehydrogenase
LSDPAVDGDPIDARLELLTVRGHVEDARAKGATVVAGGRHGPDLGPVFYEATVLVGLPRSTRSRTWTKLSLEPTTPSTA